MLTLLILIPLIWIIRFKDWAFGFVAVSGGIIVANTFFSILLQAFGVFKFPYLLTFQIIIALVTLIFNYKVLLEKIRTKKLKNFKSVSWFFVASLAVIALQFYFVHFDYSGRISSLTGLQIVDNFKSGHPYFSDEWIAIGMSEKSIETGSLPFTNILNEKTFPNFLFVFHSMISGIDLILDLNLLTAYQGVSIVFSLMIIIVAYVLLREFKVSTGVALLTIFFISYLPNSSNLPLLWYLLPWNVGFLFFLIYLLAVKKEFFKLAIVYNLLSIIFYPPIVLISLPSFLLSIIKIKSKREKILNTSIYFGSILIGLVCAAVLLSIVNNVSIFEILKTIFNFISRDLESGLGQPPLFIIWKVIPWFTVPFAFWSLWKIRRKEAFVAVPIFIGLILWFLYSTQIKTFLMDYHRVVAVTSILLVIISGLSLETFKDYLVKKIKFLNGKNFKTATVVLMLILFFILSFSFTKREVWVNFRVFEFQPAPPVNNYLNQDDLKLFENIKNKRFLAHPWKGLILGVLTDNTPMVTKPSTLTVNIIPYEEFIAGDCKKKKELAKKFNINYVYTSQFSCDGFELVGKSTENFHLYLVK